MFRVQVFSSIKELKTLMKVKVTTTKAGEDLERSDKGKSGDGDSNLRDYIHTKYYVDESVRFPCPIYNVDSNRWYVSATSPLQLRL